MKNASSASVAQKNSADAAMTAIAHETDMSVDLVRAIYEQELAAVSARATVKTFVGVIASRNVKRRLRGLGAKH